MIFMRVSMCHHHFTGGKSLRHDLTNPSTLQNQPTSKTYHLTAPLMKTTNSSSGVSASSQFTPGHLELSESALASMKVDGSQELFQSMSGAEPIWVSQTPPSFGSGTESSPSLSSSFDFMDAPKEEPTPYGLPMVDSDFMANPPYRPVILETNDAPFIADSPVGSSNINSSFQWPMSTETDSWHPHYHLDRLAWPAPTTLTSSSWPMPGNMGMTFPDAEPISPYNLAHSSLLSPKNNHSHIPLSAPRPDELDYASVTPPGIGTSQPQPVNSLPRYTGLPSMPDCSTSFSTPPSSTMRLEHAQTQHENPAIKASLHYSDARNALLIQWKRAGLSYKDIKRMGGFKEAESTLRGRFRTLTKAKEQRVRKPKWLKRDVSIPLPPYKPGDESRQIEWTSSTQMNEAQS